VKDRDICERLQAIADLKAGASIPEWLYDEGGWEVGGWNVGMSKLLREAIAEIKRLRERP